MAGHALKRGVFGFRQLSCPVAHTSNDKARPRRVTRRPASIGR
jgi:hypothetical protein